MDASMDGWIEGEQKEIDRDRGRGRDRGGGRGRNRGCLRGRGRVADSAQQFLCNPIMPTDNVTTNQKKVHTFCLKGGH